MTDYPSSILFATLLQINREHDHGLHLMIFFFMVIVPLLTIGMMYLHHHSKLYEYKVWQFFKYLIPLSKEQIRILEMKLPFYRTLSEKAKVVFRKRVRHFIINKRFVSATDIEVTEEMKVMIAASSVQILFGRDAYYLSNFHTIEISENNDVRLKELKRTKRIHISWEAFKIGHALADGNNPGIKTMAMALSLEYQFSKKGIFNRSAYLTFDTLYKQQAEKYIQSGRSAYYNFLERFTIFISVNTKIISCNFV